MKFLADEGVESLIVEYLREDGHDTLYIAEMTRGISDEEVLKIAVDQDRILITRDKDFGEWVYMTGKIHSGIVLNRLAGLSTINKAALVRQVIQTYETEIYGSFTVIKPGSVRIRNIKE